MLWPLPRSFYAPSAADVARELLGQWLIRRTPEGTCGGLIVESEAYLANDPACHGFGGETARNRSMYGEPGHAYVYLIYGMHFCVNAVCRPKGCAEAVLIRAIEASLDTEQMKSRRKAERLFQLTNGPAKLCEALAIDRRLDGVDLCDPSSPLLIAENPTRKEFLVQHGPIQITRRIGITKAAEEPLRFVLGKNPFISRRSFLGN